MKHILVIFAVFLIFGAFCVQQFIPSSAQAADMGIAVVVNQDAISLSDLNDRMNLIIISSRLPNTDDTRTKLLPQIVGSLVEEQLKLQEAERLEIEVTQGEINKGLASIAEQNKVDPEEFKQMLGSSGVNIGTMEHQIRAEIGWGKVIQAKLRPQVSISDSDIDNVIDRIKKNVGKTEYLVSEIFIPIEIAAQEPEVRDLAFKLVQQIRAGQAPFGRVAQQFSKAAGAPQGGDLGWVQQGQMAPELDRIVTGIEKGTVSDPVRTLGGFHIIALRDTRVINEESVPPRENIERNLGMERLDRLQRRYLLDLKSAAFIENRLGS